MTPIGVNVTPVRNIEKTQKIKKTGNNVQFLTATAPVDSYSFTAKKSELRKEFEEAKSQQGLIGKAWDGIKNIFGMKNGSKNIEKIIKQAEKGEISQEEAQKAIEKYKEGQNTSVDVVADITSGIASAFAFSLGVGFAPFTGGASIALGLALSTAAGAGIKTGIKAWDAKATGKEYNKKDLIYDVATGSINGLLAPITNGLGNCVTKTIGKKLGLEIFETSAKKGVQKIGEQAVKQGFKQTVKSTLLNQTVDVAGGNIAKRALALGAGMAIDGALGGASDNMVRAGLNGENVVQAGIEGAVGGLIMAPVIGGGLRGAGKAGVALNNKITMLKILPDGINTKFKQGSVGDCALLSTIDGMMNNPTTAKTFKKSITKTVAGDYNVKIGNEVVRVAKSSLTDEMLSDKTGIRIFEQAYKQLVGDIDGGFAEVVAKQFGLNPVHIANESITDELLDNLAKNQTDTVLSFGALVDTNGAITNTNGQRHYFTIKSIDADTKMVKLTSPIDTSKTIELSYDDVKALGISIDGGTTKQIDLPNAVRNADDAVFRAGKTKVDTNTAQKAAERISDRADIQEALVRMATEEGIVIRTKADAIPILQKQFQGIKDKKNLIVLDINPQDNNGMPKSNNLISRWFIEANDLSPEQLITLTERDFKPGRFQSKELCSEWGQGTTMNKKLQKISQRLENSPRSNPMSVQQAREIIRTCQSLSADEILNKYTELELGQAIAKINSTTITPFKNNGGYAGALAEQIKEAIAKANGEPITIVIPDDCSLSGSSILCDSVKILDILFRTNNIDSKVNIVFSPMILGEEAENVISQFRTNNTPLTENYLKKINAIRADGKESFKDARKAFERVKNLENIDIVLSNDSIKAVHFTETDTFKQIGKENRILQQELLYLMQGPMDGNNALFGGFGQCGVMVVTPTDNFTLNGQTYAGKIPTNSVGFMEVLGQECGVLNDGIKDEAKGLFTKGTGPKYTRYCEWQELNKPTKESDRIPIIVENGIVRQQEAS